MIPAYSDTYLADAEDCLASAFDYAVCDCHVPGNVFADVFARSDVGRQFEVGNPAIVAGLSGLDLACKVLVPCGLLEEEPAPTYGRALSAEYWAGWSLAQFQWSRGCRFVDIFARVPFSQIVGLYHPLHEADVSVVSERLEAMLAQAAPSQTNLARLRKLCRLSQSQLARAANVGLKSIQAYEQGTNDINKASGQTLWRLATALGCPIESLLEYRPQTSIEYLPQG